MRVIEKVEVLFAVMGLTFGILSVVKHSIEASIAGLIVSSNAIMLYVLQKEIESLKSKLRE